jgi:hypothetical protein
MTAGSIGADRRSSAVSYFSDIRLLAIILGDSLRLRVFAVNENGKRDLEEVV